MKKLIEKFWDDMHVAITTQDKSKITQNFEATATYKCRIKDGWLDVTIDEMAASCLEYKPILDKKYAIDRIDEMADGSWVSIITCSVSGKPYFTVSYFKFKNDKIVELVEYYGDF